MLDEMDRAYLAHKIRHAEERASSARDERTARPFLDLVAEYRRELRELPDKAAADHGAMPHVA